jgi:catalase
MTIEALDRRDFIKAAVVVSAAAAALGTVMPQGAHCKEITPDDLKSRYPSADAFLGEQLQPGEVEVASRLIATLSEKIRSDYAAGRALRDAHPKAHGCVDASLSIDADLDATLIGGVFQPGASYNAIIRFSNGSPDATSSDANGDTRGMAMKLFDVPGKKLFNAPGNPDVQDFILISSPFFFINSAVNYARFFEAINSGEMLSMLAIPFYLGFQGSWHAIQMLRQTIANPVETQYWSVVPYQLGLGASRQAVKYSVRPRDPGTSVIPPNPAPNFLRDAMAKTLAAGPWVMDFMIQRRGDTGLSVEDSVTEWPESAAPFRRIGTLTLHQQNFNTPARDAYGENLSFNPWHSLDAHRPLGMINRTRRVVYEAIAELRHEMNRTSYPAGRP